MGFFSWKTSDTKRSIPNAHASKETFTVFLKDDKGNIWEEKAYDGYGKFNSKDYHELQKEIEQFVRIRVDRSQDQISITVSDVEFLFVRV